MIRKILTVELWGKVGRNHCYFCSLFGNTETPELKETNLSFLKCSFGTSVLYTFTHKQASLTCVGAFPVTIKKKGQKTTSTNEVCSMDWSWNQQEGRGDP